MRMRKRDSIVPRMQLRTNPRWLHSQVENGKYLCLIGRFTVVDAKRKPIREHAMEAKMQSVNTTQGFQSFDVFHDSLQKIIPDTQLNAVIEIAGGLNVLRCPLQNDHLLHE